MTVTGDTAVGATFVKLPTLAVTLAGSGHGAVASDPAGIDCGATCTATFPLAAHVTLKATPLAGSRFTGWSGACSRAAPTCSLALSDAAVVTAGFTLVPAPCVVPRLRGRTLAGARAALAAAHCSLGPVRRAPATAIGRVVAQSAAPGRRLAHGAPIGVTIGVRRT